MKMPMRKQWRGSWEKLEEPSNYDAHLTLSEGGKEGRLAESVLDSHEVR